MTPNLNKIPQWSIDTLRHRLVGWDEYDRWAQIHVPWWCHGSQEARYHGLDELERARLLAMALLEQYLRTQAKYSAYLSENPPRPGPITTPDGKTWRYVGP